jgi:peptide/nickel transport system substrate-binding protein
MDDTYDRILGSGLSLSLTRRRLMAIAGLTAATGLLAACGGDDDDDDDGGAVATATTGGSGAAATATTGDGAAAATTTDGGADATATSGDAGAAAATTTGGGEEPRTGGTLFLVVENPPPNFDVHQNSTNVVYRPMAPCYSLLVQYTVEAPTELTADLAETWETSDDGLIATFNLRQGVKFHHGKELVAEDVQVSLDRIANPPEGMSSPRKAVFSTLESIDTPDEYTVVLNLTAPTASLIANLGQGWMSIFPKDVLDEKGDMKADVVGTGPFKLKSHTEGVSVELERNPDYFMPDRPYLDAITFYVIPDPNTIQSNFLSGELHQAGADSAEEAQKIIDQLGADNVLYELIVGPSLQVLEMNAEREPWGDTRVRQACNLAIDRTAANEFLEDGLSGFDKTGINGIMIPSGAWSLSLEELEQIPGYTTDPAKKEEEIEQAKALLAEAGFPDGLEATMLVRQGQEYEATAIFLQDQLKKIGVNVTLDVRETATFYELQDAREFDLFGGSYSIAIDDPDAAYFGSWVTGSGRNYSNYGDPEFDALAEQQSQELDVEKRRELVHQCEKMAMERALKAVLPFRTTHMMQYAKVRNYKRVYTQYITETHRDTWLAED